MAFLRVTAVLCLGLGVAIEVPAQQPDLSVQVSDTTITLAVGFALVAEPIAKAASRWDRFACQFRAFIGIDGKSLTFSELVMKLDGSMENGSGLTLFLLRIFDFDIGLTLCDIYVLGDRARYWEERKREIDTGGAGSGHEEMDALLREMMEDPQMRKAIGRMTGVLRGAFQRALTTMSGVAGW